MNKNITTHSITQVEELIYELHEKMINAITKIEKQAILKKLKPLEKHWNSIQEKHINGKKYPERLKSLYDPAPQTEKEKQELLKLIDSVETIKLLPEECEGWRDKGVNLSGV